MWGIWSPIGIWIPYLWEVSCCSEKRGKIKLLQDPAPSDGRIRNPTAHPIPLSVTNQPTNQPTNQLNPRHPTMLTPYTHHATLQTLDFGPAQHVAILPRLEQLHRSWSTGTKLRGWKVQGLFFSKKIGHFEPTFVKGTFWKNSRNFQDFDPNLFFWKIWKFAGPKKTWETWKWPQIFSVPSFGPRFGWAKHQSNIRF